MVSIITSKKKIDYKKIKGISYFKKNKWYKNEREQSIIQNNLIKLNKIKDYKRDIAKTVLISDKEIKHEATIKLVKDVVDLIRRYYPNVEEKAIFAFIRHRKNNTGSVNINANIDNEGKIIYSKDK